MLKILKVGLITATLTTQMLNCVLSTFNIAFPKGANFVPLTLLLAYCVLSLADWLHNERLARGEVALSQETTLG